MLTENDLTNILFLYLVGALAGWLVFCVMTRWLCPLVLRGQVRAIVLTFIITPCPITPGGQFAAPAWAVIMMDWLRNGEVTRQDAVIWFKIFGIILCGLFAGWAIVSWMVSRAKAKREAAETYQLASSHMSDQLCNENVSFVKKAFFEIAQWTKYEEPLETGLLKQHQLTSSNKRSSKDSDK